MAHPEVAEGARKVLLPVDESENSMRSVVWFIENGLKPTDHIILFHSVDTTHIIPSMGYTLAGSYHTTTLPFRSQHLVLPEVSIKQP